MSNYKETLEIYDRIVAMNQKFAGKGKTMPYTSANGYMISLLNKDVNRESGYLKNEGGSLWKIIKVVFSNPMVR